METFMVGNGNGLTNAVVVPGYPGKDPAAGEEDGDPEASI